MLLIVHTMIIDCQYTNSLIAITKQLTLQQSTQPWHKLMKNIIKICSSLKTWNIVFDMSLEYHYYKRGDGDIVETLTSSS